MTKTDHQPYQGKRRDQDPPRTVECPHCHRRFQTTMDLIKHERSFHTKLQAKRKREAP